MLSNQMLAENQLLHRERRGELVVCCSIFVEKHAWIKAVAAFASKTMITRKEGLQDEKQLAVVRQNLSR